MKKFFLSLIITFFLTMSSMTFASYKETIKQNIHASVTKFIESKSQADATISLIALRKILVTKKSHLSLSSQRIIAYVLDVIDYQLQIIPNIGTNEGNTEIYDIPNIDMGQLKRTRLYRYNQERSALDLPAYSYHPKLDVTAQTRANILKTRYDAQRPNFGDIHKRTLTDGYYDYNKIADRMADRGVIASNIGGKTFSENVGYGLVVCPPSGDCTDATIEALETTRDFYLGEKSTNGAHYASMTSKYFKYIGVGLVKDSKGYYRIVTHYATDVE